MNVDDASDALVAELSRVVLKRVSDDDLTLPGLPWVLRRAASALGESPFDPDAVGRAIESDPLAVARLLRVANSPSYSDGTAVLTIAGALKRLGARIVRIVIDDAGCERLVVSRNDGINRARRRIWEHAVAVALVARDLAGFAGGLHGDLAESAFVGGLLHDLGKPVMACLLLDSERRLLRTGLHRWLPEDDWVRVIRGGQTTVGRLMAVKWGFPSPIRHCIAEPYAYDPWKPHAISNFVCLANALVERSGLDMGPIDEAVLGPVLQEGTRLLGVPESSLAWAGRDLEQRVLAFMGEWGLGSVVVA